MINTIIVKIINIKKYRNKLLLNLNFNIIQLIKVKRNI